MASNALLASATRLRWGGWGEIRNLPAWEQTLLPGEKGDVLELDALWSFVQAESQEVWLWITLGRRTRQTVAYTVGDRRQESACDLRANLPPDSRRRAVRNDFWLSYEAAVPRCTQRFCGKEEGETNHAERWFGTLRARVSRLVRRSYAFSKSVERHLEAIHLCIVTHNLQIKLATTA